VCQALNVNCKINQIMTIVWDNTRFEGPYLMSRYSIPNGAGVYAIMKHREGTWYDIIYFGESANFEERITAYHHKFECWKRQAGTIDNVYFGIHNMGYSTQNQRLQLEGELIERYKPNCNY
jgi:excinuclease UvrABC nuclease subunit